MISIGQFAKKAQVSARTVRYYESIGLLPRSRRGPNNYRTYDPEALNQMARIRDLQSLGFRLEEIRSLIGIENADFKGQLQRRLSEIDRDSKDLEERRQRIEKLLFETEHKETESPDSLSENRNDKQNLQEQILQGLRLRSRSLQEATKSTLSRDGWFQSHPEFGEFLEGLRKCFKFAQRRGLNLGPPRGSAPASLSLFGLGFSQVDPFQHNLIPERLASQEPYFHIDVEYERGQEFVDYCQEITRGLEIGEIQAFKMPLIDIVHSVHQSIGRKMDEAAIADDSDEVLSPFRNADIEKIFQFDFSEDALVMKYENFLPEYRGKEKMTEYLSSQPIQSFRDVINITALWRPTCPPMLERLDRYRRAKTQGWTDPRLQLNDRLHSKLMPNFGVVIYHEDLIELISQFTGWDFRLSNELRRQCLKNKKMKAPPASPLWLDFEKRVPPDVAEFVAEESRWSFCLPHALSFASFTKQTAVLKTLHRDVYLREIEKFEQKFSVRWDDIGIRLKGVSLHQC